MGDLKTMVSKRHELSKSTHHPPSVDLQVKDRQQTVTEQRIWFSIPSPISRGTDIHTTARTMAL
ncbi:hypothetical protein J6590_036157 [Homalodisca vitripennis]|nr:hypothetical protein J6590_036157 [Homalodisca vitripennis]